MKPSRANPELSYFLRKSTILIIIITLTSISFIYLFARNIPLRIANGNRGHIAISTLDEVRRPFLDIHKAESFLLSDGYSKTIQVSFEHGINSGLRLIADFKTISAYNPKLLERVEKLANMFEEWIKIEQVLFDQLAGNGSTNIGLIDVENLNIIAGTSKYFSNTMDTLGDAEIPIHNDIQEGSLAVTEVMIVGGILLVVLISMVFLMQWFKNKKLRKLFIINEHTEERLRAIIDNTTAVIYLKDIYGRYILINSQYESLFHISKKEVIGKTDYDIFPKDKADVFLENDRKVLDAMTPLEFEEVVPHDNGLHTYISLKFPLLDIENIAYGVCGISTDITERKLFEEGITSFAHILEESLNEIYIFDVKTLRLILVNKGARLNLGYSMEELSCMTPLDLKPEFTSESFEKLLVPLRTGKMEKIQFTTVHRRKDGSLYDIEVHLQHSSFQSVPVFVAITLDITARKQAEDLLRESEEKSLLLLNSTGESIYGLDLKGNCTFCNPSCLSLLGYEDESQLLGRNMHNLIHHTRKDGTPYPEEECCIYQAFREGKGICVDDEVLWRADGTSFASEYRSFPIFREGKTIGSVVSFVDITERKQVERELKDLNESLENRVNERTSDVVKLSHAVEQSSSTVVITDVKGDIEYVNQRFTQTTGYTSEEALGQNPRILKSGEQGAEVYKELWDTITSGSEWKGEFHNRRKNGELYWEFASISPIKDKDGVITNIVAVKEDITDRKRMEEELRNLNESLEQRVAERTSKLVKTNKELQAENTMRIQAEHEIGIRNSYIRLHQVAACAANESKGIGDGFEPVLTEVCRTKGWSIGHVYLVSEDVSACLVPMTTWYIEDAERFAAFRNITETTNFLRGVGLPGRVLSSGKPQWIVDVTKDSNFPRASIAEEVGLKSGFAFPVMVGTEVVAVLEFFNVEAIEPDNTLLEIVADIGKDLGLVIERSRADEALRKSEASLLEAQRIAKMGNWDWDIVNNKLHWSDEIYRIFGLKPQEFEATYDAFLRSVHPDDREVVKKAVNEAIYENAPYSIEHRIVVPGGTERIVHEQAEVTFNEDGKPIRMIGTVQDITENKRREKELIKAQKLDSIGMLAGGIAHDFNNYLQGIMSCINLAQAYADDKVKEPLEKAQKIISKSKYLSQRLITFSKGGDPVRQTIFISKLIKDSVALVISSPRFHCKIGVPDSLWPVEADKGQMNQVFSNIVINAKQAMPNGGKITVFAENIEIDKKTYLTLKEGMYVKVTFNDQGTGISHENLQKIFDPYFTTKKSGNGLGLATSFSIIKRHGGYISVESELGIGTTFHIYLPASMKVMKEMSNLGETKIESTEKASINDKGKILLMDDDGIIRLAIARQLRHIKYDVEEVNDGTEAIVLYKKAFESHKPFDAVVMDLTIPDGMGGKEAIKELLKIDPEARVIVASGYVDDATMAEYKQFGFKGALTKPYEIDELNKTLQKVITG